MENDKFFSALTPAERRISFFSEQVGLIKHPFFFTPRAHSLFPCLPQALYFTYFDEAAFTMGKAKSFWQGLEVAVKVSFVFRRA